MTQSCYQKPMATLPSIFWILNDIFYFSLYYHGYLDQKSISLNLIRSDWIEKLMIFYSQVNLKGTEDAIDQTRLMNTKWKYISFPVIQRIDIKQDIRDDQGIKCVLRARYWVVVKKWVWNWLVVVTQQLFVSTIMF